MPANSESAASAVELRGPQPSRSSLPAVSGREVATFVSLDQVEMRMRSKCDSQADGEVKYAKKGVAGGDSQVERGRRERKRRD
jgi:hypothetical protein